MKNNLQKEILEVIENEYPNLAALKHLLFPTLLFSLDDNNHKNYSKIGGNPTHQIENSEPKSDLKFLAQIDLAEYRKIDKSYSFDGIIFFYLKDELDIYPLEKTDFSVFFVEKCDIKDFKPSNSTDGNSIVVTQSFTLPSYQENIVLSLKSENNQFEELEEIVLEANSIITNMDYDFAHQILGQPQALQGTVRFWWAINYLGFQEKSEYSESEQFQLRIVENEFLLLLQLNLSDPKINYSAFGDSILYFGIHKSDFENKNFEKTILVIQNT